MAWFSLPSIRFRFSHGQPARFDSSDYAYREFCPKCGTQLTFREHAQPQEVDITIASLDDPNQVTPKDHIWTQSRIDWFELADALPRYAQRRKSGSETTAPK